MTEFLAFLGKYEVSFGVFQDIFTISWRIFVLIWVSRLGRRIARLEDRMLDKEDDA